MFINLFQNTTKDRLPVDELLSHLPPLCALSRKYENKWVRLSYWLSRNGGITATRREPFRHFMNDFAAIVANERKSIVVMLTLLPCRSSDGADVGIRRFEKATPARHRIANGIVGSAGKRKKDRAFSLVFSSNRKRQTFLFFLRHRRRGLENDVRVGSTKTETVHPNDWKMITEMRKRLKLCRYLELELVEWDIRIRVLEIEVCRHLIVMKNQCSLGDTGNTRT